VQEKEGHGVVKIGLTRCCFVRLLPRDDGWLRGWVKRTSNKRMRLSFYYNSIAKSSMFRFNDSIRTKDKHICNNKMRMFVYRTSPFYCCKCVYNMNNRRIIKYFIPSYTLLCIIYNFFTIYLLEWYSEFIKYDFIDLFDRYSNINYEFEYKSK